MSTIGIVFWSIAFVAAYWKFMNWMEAKAAVERNILRFQKKRIAEEEKVKKEAEAKTKEAEKDESWNKLMRKAALSDACRNSTQFAIQSIIAEKYPKKFEKLRQDNYKVQLKAIKEKYPQYWEGHK